MSTKLAVTRRAIKYVTLFLVVLSLPIDGKFYTYLFSGNWTSFHITDLVNLTGYLPSYFGELDNERYLGLGGFSSWLVIAAIAAALFYLTDRLSTRYAWLADEDRLYDWARIFLRYRLAFLLIAYGAIKLFPLQFPHPSLSNLYTNYGDFLNWKIWYHTLGVTPNYTAFLGGVEVLAGVLLFYRRTVVFGAGLTIGLITNVVFSSFSYEMGNQVLPVYVFLVGFFLFAHDLPRLYTLLFREQATAPDPLGSPLPVRWQVVSKGLSWGFAFVIVLAALFNYKQDPYLTPSTPGLAGTAGFYNVREFILNNDTIPYSRTDTNRWQNVIFEKWATVSIKTAKPVRVDSSRYLTKRLPDFARVYESAGVDGRRYFGYALDTLTSTLQLKNKNAHHREEEYNLTIRQRDGNTIVLEGWNERQDSIKAVLERADRKLLLLESRRFPIQL